LRASFLPQNSMFALYSSALSGHCGDRSALMYYPRLRPSTRLPRLAFEGEQVTSESGRTMRPMRSSRHSIYVLALALILFSQQIVSQTQSSSQPSTSSNATSNTKPKSGKVNCTNNGTYVNSKGQTVQRPENCSGPPQGATAQCRDGSYSFSQSRRGTCSHHGGVAKWL
jgi:hypothetical protein